jgi:hypothetical protein
MLLICCRLERLGMAVPTEQAPHALHSPKAPATNGICYHGGPILHGTANRHFIWYGNFVTGRGGKFYSQRGGFGFRVSCCLRSVFLNASLARRDRRDL